MLRRRSNRSRIGVQQVAAENSRGLSMRISALSMLCLTNRSGLGLSAGLSFGALETRVGSGQWHRCLLTFGE
jgi:hypothetical protein